MTPLTAAGRLRAFRNVFFAIAWYVFAQWLAGHAANGLASGTFAFLVERAMLLFLLVVGFAGIGLVFDRQKQPVREMGLSFRPGWGREFGIGAALGWGMLVVSILPLVLSGGLIVTFWATPRQFGVLLEDLLLLAVAALAEEVAFRGYPFQRLVAATGPFLATFLSSLVFAGMHLSNPGFSRISFWITMVSGWLLSVAYLRTRALWVAWGWHFAWNASMCLLFGLPISGLTQFSPVIQSNTIGPEWMTGGDYGPEAARWTFLVLLVGVIVVYRSLRGYAWLYTQPEIVAAGIPVNLDAMSSTLAPHHPPPAPPAGSTLVQILPLPSSAAAIPLSTAPVLSGTPNAALASASTEAETIPPASLEPSSVPSQTENPKERPE